MDHIGVVVDDLEEGKRFLAEVLGLQLERALEVSALKRRVAFFRCGEVEIELIEDLDPDAKQRVLGGASAVVEHVALEVDDLDGTMTALSGLGVRAGLGPLRAGGRVNLWTDPASTDGVMYQLLQKDA